MAQLPNSKQTSEIFDAEWWGPDDHLETALYPAPESPESDEDPEEPELGAFWEDDMAEGEWIDPVEPVTPLPAPVTFVTAASAFRNEALEPLRRIARGDYTGEGATSPADTSLFARVVASWRRG